MDNLKSNIAEYIKGKKWYWYMPALLIVTYLFYCIVKISPSEPLPTVLVPISAVDFGLHEMAHVITGAFPAVITAASGSLSEIFLGMVLVFTALRTRYYFTSLFCTVWFAFGCKSAGQYMADARAQQLDLVSPFSDNAIHDWHFVFGKLHLLQQDTLIGGLVKFGGYLAMTMSLVFGAWLVYKFATENESKEEQKVITKTQNPQNPQSSKNRPSIYPTATKGPLGEPPDLKK